jgi:hypothetical protein
MLDSLSSDVGSSPTEAAKFGLLEESGRPRFPVTEQITGSNPVQTAKVRGLVVYRLGWETFNLSKWVQLPPRLPKERCYADHRQHSGMGNPG